MTLERESYSLQKNLNKVESLELTERDNRLAITSEQPKEKNNKTTPKKKRNPFLGFFYVFLSAVFFSSFNVLVKKLSYISTGQLAFARNVGAFVGSLPIAVAYEGNILGKKKDRISLVARGILGGTGIYLNVLAYGLLPLADVAIIMSTVPVVTILFARIFLREKCSVIQNLSLVITLCGLFLSARLPELFQTRSAYQFDQQYVAGIAAAVGTVIILALVFVVLRKMKGVHFSLPILYFGFFGMIENIIVNGITVSYTAINCGWDQFLYILIGILGFAGNAAFTLALQVEEAGIASVVRASLEIIVAVVFQIIFFKENPDLYNIAGSFFVMLSLIILGIRNWLLSLPENSEPRKKLKYFLI